MQRVLRAQCDDRDALEALLRGVEHALRRYLSGLAGATDADDLLQDVFVLIVRKLGALDDPALFRPWVFRIASREAFRHVRKRRAWQSRHEDDSRLDELPTPPVRPSHETLSALLDTDAISPASRAVMLLHFEQDMTLAETAAVLDIPLGTAKSRLAYGLKSIRQFLDASGGSHG